MDLQKFAATFDRWHGASRMSGAAAAMDSQIEKDPMLNGYHGS
jgi:hypothetical protein